MATVVIYSSEHCPYCQRARALLEQKNIPYTEIKVDSNPEEREAMIAKTGRRTVPQIFINGQHIGGCDDLFALNKQGQLDTLLRG